MTACAGLRCVRPEQRKCRRGVAERRRLPGRHGVTLQTIMGKLVGEMSGIDGVIVSRLVALPAVSIFQRVISTHMTIDTWNRHMTAEERKGCCTVIECGRFIRALRMALQTIMRELV